MNNELIDYAMPMMRMEKMLKDMHNHLLDHKSEEAQDIALHLIAEAKILFNTLYILREQHALRK
jgi:crotonobetainyl-CoA:carnitine CoA-transferase CaiB-like acyl-CoA transferase